MSSPFSNSEAVLKHEPATVKFRGETYKYVYYFYECPETHERFTTIELDEENVGQVYNKYREKYGIWKPTLIMPVDCLGRKPIIKSRNALT